MTVFCLLTAVSSHAAILHQETVTANGASVGSLNLPTMQGGTAQLYVAAVAVYETGVNVASISGGGLTWILQKTQCAAGVAQPHIDVWQAFGSPGVAFTPVVTLTAAAQRVSAAVTRYSGASPTLPTEGAAGSNTNGLNGVCGGGASTTNLSLSLTSTLNDSVLYVASHPRHRTLSIEDPDYAQRTFISNSSGVAGANLYVHDRTLLAAGTDSADHTASAAVDWDMAGLVIRPAPSEDATVIALGTQTVGMFISSTNQYVGGKFVIVDNAGSRNVTGITVTESGTVDGLNNLDNIKLFYELDTTAPYDGASESYGGTETQFGVTDTTGFSAANGTSAFTGSVGISTTAAMVVYVVFDVGTGAVPGETVEISIGDPSTEVTVSSGTVGPTTPIAIAGTTTLSGGVIYYSVGTDAAALYSGNASASGGTLTLAAAAIDKIGVGDEVRVGANRYYITGRNSPTEFTIQNSGANGGTPGNTNISFGSTAIAIFRAFNSLTAAESGSSDANHLGTANLAASGFQLNWTCYDDAAMDNGQIVIDGWTTSATRYIRIYTPTDATEVGVSQHHTGIAGSGFRLAPTADGGGLTYVVLTVMDDFVRIQGIEIDGTNVSNALHITGIRLDATLTATSQPHLDSLIIHDLENVNGASQGDTFGIHARQGSPRISNSLIYALDDNNSHPTAEIAAIGWSSTNTGTSYVHNVTIYDVKNNVSAGNARGLDRDAGTVIVKNVAVFDVASTNGPEACFSGTFHASSSNNVSSDSTAPGPGSQTDQTSYARYFVDVNAGTEDLHLKDNSFNLWERFGTDLDSDPNLPVTEDVDGETRDALTPDIGADEFTVTTGNNLAQVHYRWRNDDGGEMGATWAVVEDTKLMGLLAGFPRRLRFQVTNQNASSTGPMAYRLEVAQALDCGVGAYAPVPTDTSGHWQVVGSGFVTDGEATSNVTPGLSDEGSVFVAGEVKDAGNTTGTIALNFDQFTELEFVLQATPNANAGANYCFRLTAGGTPLPAYSLYAQAVFNGSMTLMDHDLG
ncbi:MAG: hypothetical protein ACREF4_05385, partial [Gammaproteobacteria bacterium]